MRAIERHKGRLPWNREHFMGLGSLHDEMHRRISELFTEMPEFEAFGPPAAIDVIDGEESVKVKVELPGVEKKDVEISMGNNLLTIKGEKKSEKEEKGENRYLVERRYGAFSRTLELPARVRSEDVKATCKDGVLEIVLQKSDEEKVRDVKINIE